MYECTVSTHVTALRTTVRRRKVVVTKFGRFCDIFTWEALIHVEII